MWIDRQAGKALSATSGETPLDSRADTPSAHSRTWEAPLLEGDGNLEAEEPNHVDPKPTEEQQEQQLPQDHQEAAQQDLRDDQSAKFVIHDDDDTCEPHARGVVEAEVLPQASTKIDESKQQAVTPQVPRELQEFETAVLAFAQALDADVQVGDDDKPHRASQTHCRQAHDEQDWSAPSRPAPPTTTEENLGGDLPDGHGHEEQCAAELPGRGTWTSEDSVTRAEPSCEAGSPSAEPRAGEEELALAALALLQLMSPRIKEETLTEGGLGEAAQVTQTTSSPDADGSLTAPAQDSPSFSALAQIRSSALRGPGQLGAGREQGGSLQPPGKGSRLKTLMTSVSVILQKRVMVRCYFFFCCMYLKDFCSRAQQDEAIVAWQVSGESRADCSSICLCISLRFAPLSFHYLFCFFTVSLCDATGV